MLSGVAPFHCSIGITSATPRFVKHATTYAGTFASMKASNGSLRPVSAILCVRAPRLAWSNACFWCGSTAFSPIRLPAVAFTSMAQEPGWLYLNHSSTRGVTSASRFFFCLGRSGRFSTVYAHIAVVPALVIGAKDIQTGCEATARSYPKPDQDRANHLPIVP